MSRPTRRGPSRRNGSYSSQRATSQRPAPGNRRSNSGYGGGRASGGNDQMPIYIGLGVGAVVLIGALIFLLAGGGDDATPVVRNRNPVAQPAQPTVIDPNAPAVLKAFSSAEQERIRATIEALDEDYDEAKDLKDQGFLAQNRQDYEDAQAAWKEAQRLLDRMDSGSNALELEFGDDVWERLEQFMPTVNRTIQRWGKLRREFTKYLK